MPRKNTFCNSKDYERYLVRHEWEGEGLPQLDEAEFCRLQDELMDLLADRAAGGRLSADQRERIGELRKLLLSDL